MGLPTVKRFCFCCNLETGGLIIGWITAITSFFFFLGSIGLVFIGSTALLVGPNRGDAIALIIVGAIFVLYYLIYFIAGIGIIMAVRHRDPQRMQLIMTLMVIGIFIAWLSLLLGQLMASLFGAIVYMCVYIYFFICIYSLWKMLVNEKMGNHPGVTLQPIQPL